MTEVYEVQLNSKGAPNFATAQKVVRCRDCVHNQSAADSGNAKCELYYGMTDQMGFCHMGERRDV